MRIVKRTLSEIIVLFFVVVTLVPILWIFLMSIKSNIEIFNFPLMLPYRPRWDNYRTAWERVSLPHLAGNTMYIAVFALSIGTTLGILSSFVIARFRHFPKLTKIFYTYYMSGIITPVFILLLPVFLIVSRFGLTDNHWGLILTYIGWSAAMNTLLLVAAFRNVPSELEEAAAIDGCGTLRICWQIFVPAIKPTLATVLLLSFLGVWNEFPLASVLIFNPGQYTIALATSFFKGMYSIDYAVMTSAIMLIVLPQLILFAFFQRFVIEGVTAGAIKG